MDKHEKNIMARAMAKRYPEHFKMYQATLDARAVAKFLDWLRDDPAIRPHLGSTGTILERYFKIDDAALEKETEAMQTDETLVSEEILADPEVDAMLKDLLRRANEGDAPSPGSQDLN